MNTILPRVREIDNRVSMAGGMSVWQVDVECPNALRSSALSLDGPQRDFLFFFQWKKLLWWSMIEEKARATEVQVVRTNTLTMHTLQMFGFDYYRCFSMIAANSNVFSVQSTCKPHLRAIGEKEGSIQSTSVLEIYNKRPPSHSRYLSRSARSKTSNNTMCWHKSMRNKLNS